MKKILRSPKKEEPKRWGRWILDEKDLSLFISYDNDEKRYSIPLFLCNNPEITLGWIISIHEKDWTTNKDIGDLVEALNDLLIINSSFDRTGYEHDNGNIEYTRDVVQQRIRLNKIKLINKGG